MKHARVVAIGLALLALVVGPARAEDDIESRRSGPYVGVNAGVAIPNFNFGHFATPPPFQARTSEEVSVEVLARAGWRLFPHVAIEGQYEWIREWELKTKREQCAQASAQVFTGNVRVFAPFDAVHPYLVGGAGAGRFKSRARRVRFDNSGINDCVPKPGMASTQEDWELAVRLGGGLDVYITRHVTFNLEASTIYAPDKVWDEEFPFVSISGGLGYRF
jgi:opacity protein-like surface antigen